MGRVVQMPRDVLAHKPAHGAPCNSCGACCMATRCQIGARLFGPGGRCPALEQIGPHEYTCGVVRSVAPSGDMPDPKLYLAAVLLMRAGEGCDARFNGEPINEAFHKQQDATDAKNAAAIRHAQNLWGIT